MFNVANMSFNAIRENKILVKISEVIVHKTSEYDKELPEWLTTGKPRPTREIQNTDSYKTARTHLKLK